MYEVMARRYRPASFEEVVGQEHIAATLKNAIVRDRVAHAYLFAGGHGCGKTTMARILAKALVCLAGPTPEPCCACPICLYVAAGRDSDVLEIDGASNNGVEQIRQLREQAAYAPNRARFKIYIVDEAHMLTESAFNALLKTLEEPPRHVKFILATTDPHKLPDTILSRCQRFDFRLVPPPVLAVFFRRLAEREETPITAEALEAVSSFAGGSVRDGLVLLDQVLSFAEGEATRADVEAVRGVAPAESVAGLFAAIADSDVASALAIVDRTAASGTNVGDFLDQLVSFGRDLMVAAAAGSLDGVAAYGPARETLSRLGERTSLESALLYLDVLAQARTKARTRSLSNPLVILEMAVARLAGLGGVTPVSRLVATLEALPDAPPVPAATPPLSEPAADSANPRRPSGPPGEEVLPAGMKPVPESPPEIDGTMPKKKTGAATQSRPEPPPAPAAVLGPGEAAGCWNAALKYLMEKHASDFRYLSQVSLAGVEDGIVRLSGPFLAAESLEDRRRRARLAEALASAFGRPMEFSFSPVARQEKRETDQDLRRRLVKRPEVRQVLDLFDGVVIDCRPPAGMRAAEEPEGADGSAEDDACQFPRGDGE
ncbi:MAG: DNA polymerase III subunit gamma/tau [Planctomycetota bacterium]|nr:DNA polymerase III subunit gamma/tau [Planctomycetota bacterium]